MGNERDRSPSGAAAPGVAPRAAASGEVTPMRASSAGNGGGCPVRGDAGGSGGGPGPEQAVKIHDLV